MVNISRDCNNKHKIRDIGGVANYLNNHGYTKKLRQNGTIPGFSSSFVKAVLDNPIYMGKIAYGRRRAYTLMSKVDGQMLCEDSYLQHPEKLIKIAADGLKQLWQIDIKGCPYNTSRLSERLKAAEYNVRNGLVDVEDAEPETFGPNGFANPEELLK